MAQMRLLLFVLALTFVETAGETESDCNESVIDLVFLVDGSGSICNDDPTQPKTCDNWQLVQRFMENVVDALNIGENEVHVGLITFAHDGVIQFDTTEYFDKNRIKERIAGLIYPGGSTNTYEGLRLMRKDIFDGARGDREKVQKVAIVITDGIPTENVELTQPEALKAQAEGTFIVAVGITKKIDEETLQYLSSPPHLINKQYFRAPDFDGLQNVLKNIVEVACNQGAPPCPAGETYFLWMLVAAGIAGLELLIIIAIICGQACRKKRPRQTAPLPN